MKALRIAGSVLVLVLLISSTYLIAAQDDGKINDILDTTTFRSLDTISDQPLEVTNFANDGTATLPFETSVPVACSVVYGPTQDFGSLTTDLDMNGGAHSSHNPLLTGLKPETTYYFRAQGVDASGIVYISEVKTFTTPLLDNTPVTNLASPELGAQIVGYSSAFGGAGINDTWGAASAFDGNPNTAWSSAGDGNGAWVEVKLAQRSRITGVAFWSRSMSDGSAQVFQFTVTTDSGDVYGPFELADANQSYEFDVTFEAETLRFDVVDSSGGNTGAVDIAVYGEPVE
jgi:hypothetical protein